MSSEASVAKKQEKKRPKTSKKPEEWVEVPVKKDLRKKKTKKAAARLERTRRTRPEVVLIKPAEGMRYATILRDFKKHLNSDELGIIVQGIRETYWW